jgi:hypothetical protein
MYPHRSKLSFQYGFRVLLITVVVFVCSPPKVATANGSGNPVKLYQFDCFPMGKWDLTENIALVKSIGGNYYSNVSSECQIPSIEGWLTG